MTTLNMKVTTRKMPHTSEFFAIGKAVEHFYYSLLFTSPAYSGDADRWSTWREMGFSNAIKDAPPNSKEADRLTRRVFSDGKLIDITVTAANGETMRRLVQVLTDISSVRAATSGQGTGAGANELANKVEGQLVTPVSASLKSAGMDDDEVASFKEMLQRGLEALTYKDITAIELTVGDDRQDTKERTGATSGQSR